MTKIDIISGFLGAGKTTLIRKLLEDALKGTQVVLIENEFGEIGIDGGFLKDAGIEITEMSQGCICCSLVGDFGKALQEVIDKYHPERIIIEPSGVGKLSDVIGAVKNLHIESEDAVELNCATTVVDVTKAKMYAKNFGEFFENQIQAANTIILSRTDTERATQEKIEEAIAIIKNLNPKATIITTPVEQLPGKKVLETMEGIKIDLTKVEIPEHEEGECDDPNCSCHHHHDHDHEHCHHDHDHDHEHCHHDHDHDHEHCHHDHDHDHEHCHHHHHHGHAADEVFTSWGQETVRKYSKEEIADILKTLSESEEYGVILRSKGMVEGTDGTWIYFDMVPEEADVREGAPEFTGRLCVIGSQLKEEKLKELFKLV